MIHPREKNGAGPAVAPSGFEIAPRRPRSPRPGRDGAILAAGFGLLLTLAGCGSEPLAVRYRAERDAWSARRMERRLALKSPIDPAALNETIAAFERVLTRYPVVAARADTAEARSLTRLRAAVALELARLQGQKGTSADAARVLWDRRHDFGADLESTLRIYDGLIELLSQGTSVDSLSSILKEVGETLPMTSPSGQPIASVLEAPLKQAEVLMNAGRGPEAIQVLNDAVARYDQVIADHPGSSAQVSAMIEKASAQARAGRMNEAEESLRNARALPQAAPVEAAILLSLAQLRQQGLKDPLGAVGVLRELIRLHPTDPLASQAQLRVGIALAGGGQPDSALAAFARTEELYGKDVAAISQARFLSARVLISQGKADEAISRLRSCTVDFPRTEVGLAAPMEIAAYYDKIGDKNSFQSTLRDAASEYERLITSLQQENKQAGVIMSALDHLADARVRLQDWPKAVDVMRKRADAFPADARSPLALVQAANIQKVQLRDSQAAIETLEKLLARYPHHSLAPKVREDLARLKAGSSS